jgi:hypothetical protein
MEALGLLFVGTTLLLLIGHLAEVYGGIGQQATTALIDSVLETVQRDPQHLGQLGLELR